MSELATLRQKEIIQKLTNCGLKNTDLNFLETNCTKEYADKWIKVLIAEVNVVNREKYDIKMKMNKVD